MCPCLNKSMAEPNVGKKMISACPCHPLIPCEKARQSCCSDQSGSKSYSTFPPSLLWLHCSFVAPAAGGAVRLETSPLAFFSYVTRLSLILSSFVLSPPSLPSIRQCWATAASSTSARASLLWRGRGGGTSALNKLHERRGKGIWKQSN